MMIRMVALMNARATPLEAILLRDADLLMFLAYSSLLLPKLQLIIRLLYLFVQTIPVNPFIQFLRCFVD